MVLPAAGPRNKGCLEGRDAPGTASREEAPPLWLHLARCWEEPVPLESRAAPAQGPRPLGYSPHAWQETRLQESSVWLGTEGGVCLRNWTEPRTPSFTFLGSRAEYSQVGQGRAPSRACLGGGRCEPGERLAARTAGSRLRAPGAVGPADPGLGVGHPGAGGHPQETQGRGGWGATCARDKPDPCSSERAV